MPRVAIIEGVRTPFVKAAGAFAKHNFIDLGVHVLRELVARAQIQPESIDEICFGTVLLDPRTPNWARELVIRSQLPASINAHSVSNNCISGLVAINFIADGIKTGRLRSGLAGGSESMSRPALTLKPEAERFYLALSRARTFGERLKLLASFKPRFILPDPPSPKEPSTGLTMGQHTELIAKEYKIDRSLQDQIAYRSHQNAASAVKAGILAADIVPFANVSSDNLVRADTTVEKLSKLPPVFDRSAAGTLTAGNSSALTDGASMVYLMSDEQARKEGREILAYLDGVEFSALAPNDGLLMAPAIALPKLLQGSGLKVSEIDLFEIHEAFGAQVAANLLAWEKGWSKSGRNISPIGTIPTEKININGGSIAIGHPFAATGGRIVIALARALKRMNLKRGVISICAAGGMAGAALLSRE